MKNIAQQIFSFDPENVHDEPSDYDHIIFVDTEALCNGTYAGNIIPNHKNPSEIQWYVKTVLH